MHQVSITSIVGYARIAVILVIGGLLIAKRLTLLEATAILTFIVSALGSVGHIASRDANAPEILSQVTVRESTEKDGRPVVAVATQVEGERLESK
jgi:hypothetical protein